MELLSFPLFWLTALSFGIVGWLIKSFLAHQERIKLETTIADRDNKLMALSRDNLNTVSKLEKQILQLQTSNIALTEENAHLSGHNSDLRTTILEMMTPEELENILFPDHKKDEVEQQNTKRNELIPTNGAVTDVAHSTLNENDKHISSSTSTMIAKQATAEPEYYQKWTKTRKKYKSALIENTKLKEKISQLKKLNNKLSNIKSDKKEKEVVIKKAVKSKSKK